MKIRYIIDEILTPRITALDWVERYGGIVRTINLQVKGKGDKLEVKKYPVACDVTAEDCDSVKLQQDLVPNDNYKSVVYWEEVSPMANSGTTATNDFYTKKFKGVARIVVWLNLAKLGQEGCKDGFLTLPSLEEALTIKGNNLPAPYDGFQFWVQPLKGVKQDIDTVFGKYTYDKLKNYYLYPFDFYAIDVAFEMNQCLAKGGVYTPGASIDCPNGAGTTPCERLLAQITPELKCSCVIPSLDFTIGDDTDFDCLDAQQITDLTTRLCVGGGYENTHSLDFNGVSDYVLIPDRTEYNWQNNTSFTISAWIKIDAFHFGVIYSKLTPSGAFTGILFRVNSTGELFGLVSRDAVTNAIRLQTSTTVPLGVWTHVAITYDGSLSASGMNIYINGVAQPITVINDNLTGNTTTAAQPRIGANASGTQTFDGKMTEVRIWNVEQNAAFVLDDYNGGKPKEAADKANSIALPRFGPNALWQELFVNWRFPDESPILNEAFQTFDTIKGIRTTDVPT